MSEFHQLSTLKRMATGKVDASPAHVGRFELKRLLGQGAQSKVWLAFDPRLERDVAIKVMKPVQGSDASVLNQWLTEARSVSRLTHPNIVPVFEADVQDQQPYLVFEYVAGQTLAKVLGSKGAQTPANAVALIADVLDALVAAHAQGLVHRDLKPANVMVDNKGRARVMDFGIAQRTSDAGKGINHAVLAGTPAYMAPEAARGAPVSPVMDVYSAGMMLAEVLWGRPLQPNVDAYTAIYRAAYKPLVLPNALLSGLDDSLRAIVLRALAPDAAQRYPSSDVFLTALRTWQTQQNAASIEPDVPKGPNNSTLEFLLRRMRNKTDFPALSASVVRLQSMATSEKESVNSITNEILKDVALTNKLLRLVNSAHYSRGSSIGTVSRAVSLVGFNGIRNMSLSLVLLEHMQDKTNAQLLKEEFLRGLMAGSVAAELASSSAEGEEAFIGAMFQNLGRMLSQFYFPDEAASIRALTAASGEGLLSEESAATRVLGMGFEALGVGVARAWGLPESIQRCMMVPAGDPPSRVPSEAQARLRWTARAANDVADAMMHADPMEVDALMGKAVKKYSKALGMSMNQVQSATASARKKLVELAKVMEIRVPASSRAAPLLNAEQQEPAAQAPDAAQNPDGLDATELQATPAVQESAVFSGERGVATEQASQTLAAGIQDITNVMVEDFNLSDVLRMILEAMYRALDFQRIVFCMREPKTDILKGRFGLGLDVESVVKSFQVPLSGVAVPDLFATICNKGADTLISDASDPRLVERLPDWYHKLFHAPTFLILPLTIKGKPFGMIYADKAEKGGLKVDDKELALLRTLRNQAVMAFKQSS